MFQSLYLQTCFTFRSGPSRHIAVVWAQGNCPNIGNQFGIDQSDVAGAIGRRTTERPSVRRQGSVVRWQERRRSRSPRGGLNTRRISSVPWQDLIRCLMCENHPGVSFRQISSFLEACYVDPKSCVAAMLLWNLRHFVPSGGTRTLMVNSLDGQVAIEIKKAANQPNFQDLMSTSNIFVDTWWHVDIST